MPEAIEVENFTTCTFTLARKPSDCSSLTEDSNFIEDEKWGFRITGGADFGMPITVFHVSIYY